MLRGRGGLLLGKKDAPTQEKIEWTIAITKQLVLIYIITIKMEDIHQECSVMPHNSPGSATTQCQDLNEYVKTQ
jgi:hypothetical protein